MVTLFLCQIECHLHYRDEQVQEIDFVTYVLNVQQNLFKES
jgi:hypothetical protein